MITLWITLIKPVTKPFHNFTMLPKSNITQFCNLFVTKTVDN
uniref:Uncharacterized protein n=1 Tax=Siphoviridae sp. ctK0l2 TaxID=2826243 RepID=A0A8S5NJB8_9CAUD|nr:MAG TPA: hypothetical protein [Siphoviridae sp. ctK0l2]DAN40155.1 MAG TPA: hypothetical protein [Caudoviricetes sp.]